MRPQPALLVVACALGLALLAPARASANGAYSHVHISQIAADLLPPGDLRDLMQDPTLRLAWEAGSMFPDSGYAVSHAYGEHAHWARFRIAYLEYLRATYQGDYSSREAREQIAFLMGVASHGMADQSYDTTLLARAFEVDGPEDASYPVDQYADYFLVIDEGVVFTVDGWGPYSALSTILMGSLNQSVGEALLMMAMGRMEAVTRLQTSLLYAYSQRMSAWDAYPFLGTHIYNGAAVGSLPWLGGLVARQWEVLYRRLLETDDVDADLVIQTVPEDGGENWPVSTAQSEALGRVAIFFGYGVDTDALRSVIRVTDSAGVDVPVRFQTAYGGRERSLLFVAPQSSFAHDEVYTVEIPAGVGTLDGRTTTRAHMFSFRTRCASDRLMDCPPLDPELVAGTRPDIPRPVPDAGPGSDAGPPDAGMPGAAGGGGCAVHAARGPHFALGLVLLFALALWIRRR